MISRLKMAHNIARKVSGGVLTLAKTYTLYHGTRGDFDHKDIEERLPPYSGSLGKGIYFGQNEETAKFYGPKIIKVQVDLKNPLIIDAAEEINYRIPKETQDLLDTTGTFDSILVGERVPPFDVKIGGQWHEIRDSYDLKSIGGLAEKAGHDSLIVNGIRWDASVNEEVLVFSKKSIYKELTGKPLTWIKNKEAADRVIKSFLNITAGYDREKIKPGYKGKFVIHDHFAERAGGHFDLRIEMPVTSLAKALGNYGGKRPSGKEEPHSNYPDKPGSVYRSFAVRKHKLPTNGTKLFVVETEDHPMEYGSFKGEISEGYGKGKVDIYDKGTYEILDVEGDKKYVLDFQGEKLKGAYALVKYMNGYLWVKTKAEKYTT